MLAAASLNLVSHQCHLSISTSPEEILFSVLRAPNERDEEKKGLTIFYSPIGHGMVWYSMVTLFIQGISFRYVYIQVKKTNCITKLGSKIKTKIIKVKRKHLLFKEVVCKNNISLI